MLNRHYSLEYYLKLLILLKCTINNNTAVSLLQVTKIRFGSKGKNTNNRWASAQVGFAQMGFSPRITTGASASCTTSSGVLIDTVV